MQYDFNKRYWINTGFEEDHLVDCIWQGKPAQITTTLTSGDNQGATSVTMTSCLNHKDTNIRDLDRISEKLLPLLMAQLRRLAPDEFQEFSTFRASHEDAGWREVMRDELAKAMQQVHEARELADQRASCLDEKVSELCRMEAEVSSLRNSNVALANENTKWLSAKWELEKELKAANAALVEGAEDREELRRRLRDSAEMVTELEARLTNATEQYERAKQDRDKYYNENQTLVCALDESKKSLACLTRELEDLKRYHRQLSQEKSDLIENKSDYITLLKDDIRKLENEAERLRHVNGQTQATLADVFDEVQSAIDILRTAIGGK